eukprot:2219930-Prymnesium_polylepis.1
MRGERDWLRAPTSYAWNRFPGVDVHHRVSGRPEQPPYSRRVRWLVQKAHPDWLALADCAACCRRDHLYRWRARTGTCEETLECCCGSWEPGRGAQGAPARSAAHAVRAAVRSHSPSNTTRDCKGHTFNLLLAGSSRLCWFQARRRGSSRHF